MARARALCTLGLCLALALAASSALHDPTVGASGPEACDGGASEDGEECAAQGDALLQHASRRNLGNLESLSEEEKEEDSDGVLETGARAETSSGGSLGSWVSSLLTDGVMASAKAQVADDLRSATVGFRHAGKAVHYRLAAFSVYTDDAVLEAHTANGVERRERPSLLNGNPGTFKARDLDNEHGMWASATIALDGSVTGLFQTETGVVRLEPINGELDSSASAALLEAAKVRGLENPHLVRRLNMSALVLGQPRHGGVARRGTGASLAQGGRPCVKVDGECVHTGGDDGRDGIDHVPHMRPNQSMDGLLSGAADWNGVKWWPGCYSGDGTVHDFKMGAVMDHDGFEEHGSKASSMLAAAFVETSFIYEQQLHTKVSLKYQKIYESSSGAPSYAVGCSPVLKLEAFKAKAGSDMPAGLGSSHMFTGCGTGYGTIGMAWVGTICRTDGYATGVNQFHKTKDWLTFAHELGHNFNGGHSFEEGQGKTGGIMDYGDGLLDGEYQFNTKYRKAEMCKKMNQAVTKCGGGFDPAKDQPPTPAPTPVPPPPTPAPVPGYLKDLQDSLNDLEKEIKDTKSKIDKAEGKPPSPPPPPGATTTTTTTTTTPAPTPAPPAGVSPTDEKDWLMYHNYWRCIHGSPEVAWDKDFAKGAQTWAERGVFEQSDSRNLKPPEGPAAENLAEVAKEAFLLEADDGRTSSKQAEAVDFKELLGARVTEYNGAKIVVREDAEVVGEGNTYRWVITIPKGCTNEDLKKLTEKMPKGTTPKFEGDPDHGGLCVFIMDGTEDDVKEEIASHTWPSQPTFETDSEWSAIPEVHEDGDGPNEDQDSVADLLELDGMVGQPNPPSWGIDRVDDREGLDNDYQTLHTGKGVHVYVADTGIRTTHQDFGGRAVPTLEVLSSSPKVCQASDTSCAADRQGHGTHCAGTIGGKKYGVAKEVSLHAVKVLSDKGSGSFSWFIEALDWVMTKGTKPFVFSASLGGSGTQASVKTAIDKAVGAGLVVVVAAGNDNADACGFSPAYVPNAITVAATEKGDRRASYSCYGKCIDIFAPGSKVVSAGVKSDTGSDTMSGTSMACPHVAGGAALLLAEDGKRTPDQVLQVMLERSTKDKISDPKSGTPNKFLFTGGAKPATPPNTASIEKVVKMWHDESPEKGPKAGANCTAMIWKAATKIGCGISSKNSKGTFMVCRYGGGDPLPNTAGAFDSNVGMPDTNKEDECKYKYLEVNLAPMKDQLNDLKSEVSESEKELEDPVDKSKLHEQLRGLKAEMGDSKAEIEKLKTRLQK